MDSVDWMTSGVSFNPYQCDLSPLEVCYTNLLCIYMYICTLYTHCIYNCNYIHFLFLLFLCVYMYTFTYVYQSFPSQTETPHEALLAKLQKTETSE